MYEFDRIAQRQLENSDSEFDLGSHFGGAVRTCKEIEGPTAKSQRVSNPDTGKASGLDLPPKICDAIHQPVIGIGADPDHCAEAHTASFRSRWLCPTPHRRPVANGIEQ